MFYGFMINTWITATIIAVTAGILGFFVVIRRSAFAAHVLPLGTFPGATAAQLLGVQPIWGLLVFVAVGVLLLQQLERLGERCGSRIGVGDDHGDGFTVFKHDPCIWSGCVLNAFRAVAGSFHE